MDKANIKEEVRGLWKMCFPEDSEEFMDLYFSLRYTDEVNSCIVSGGKVVSALQRIPYPMKYIDKIINTSYISGACTHPDYRSGGLMRRLLAEAHRKMYSDGILLATLIPASHGLKGYYSKSGYTECFKQTIELLTGSEQPVNKYSNILVINKLDLCITPDKMLSDFYYQQLSTGDAAILHTPDDLLVVMSDHKLSGGDMWVGYLHSADLSDSSFSETSGSGKIAALAFTVRDTDGRLVIKELVCSSFDCRSEMIRLLCKHYNVLQAEVVVYPCSVSQETEKACIMDLGMARVINVLSLLRIYSSYLFGGGNTQSINPHFIETVNSILSDACINPESKQLLLEIYGDDAVDFNNGYYVITAHYCEKIDYHAFTNTRNSSSDLQPSYIKLSINQLGQLLLKDFNPYMNMMLN